MLFAFIYSLQVKVFNFETSLICLKKFRLCPFSMGIVLINKKMTKSISEVLNKTLSLKASFIQNSSKPLISQPYIVKRRN